MRKRYCGLAGLREPKCSQILYFVVLERRSSMPASNYCASTWEWLVPAVRRSRVPRRPGWYWLDTNRKRSRSGWLARLSKVQFNPVLRRLWLEERWISLDSTAIKVPLICSSNIVRERSLCCTRRLVILVSTGSVTIMYPQGAASQFSTLFYIEVSILSTSHFLGLSLLLLMLLLWWWWWRLVLLRFPQPHYDVFVLGKPKLILLYFHKRSCKL